MSEATSTVRKPADYRRTHFPNETFTPLEGDLDYTSFQLLQKEILANANFVFYNREIWGTIQKQKAKKILASIYEMTGGTKKESNRCFYRSTTGYIGTKDYTEKEVMEYGPVRQAAFDAGCEYIDIAHTTEEFSQMLFSNPAPPRNRLFEQRSMFMDSIHYMPWAYEGLNTLFLNILCGTQHFE